MKISFFSVARLAIVFLCCYGSFGCAESGSGSSLKDIPVRWESGFTLPDILESSDTPLSGVDDLPQLLHAPWYASLTVVGTRTGESIFSSCADYFNQSTPNTRTRLDSEMNAYVEFRVMCEALRLLLNSRNAQQSYLPEVILSSATPSVFPKEFALLISAAEETRALDDASLITWADVTPMVRVEVQSPTKSTYYHVGGYQEVEVLGYGDRNKDGVEDVFMVVRDYVENGDYFNIRLLVLSVNAKGAWHLIEVL